LPIASPRLARSNERATSGEPWCSEEEDDAEPNPDHPDPLSSNAPPIVTDLPPPEPDDTHEPATPAAAAGFHVAPALFQLCLSRKPPA
jgi:hypothetical protein